MTLRRISTATADGIRLLPVRLGGCCTASCSPCGCCCCRWPPRPSGHPVDSKYKITVLDRQRKTYPRGPPCRVRASPSALWYTWLASFMREAGCGGLTATRRARRRCSRRPARRSGPGPSLQAVDPRVFYAAQTLFGRILFAVRPLQRQGGGVVYPGCRAARHWRGSPHSRSVVLKSSPWEAVSKELESPVPTRAASIARAARTALSRGRA